MLPKTMPKRYFRVQTCGVLQCQAKEPKFPKCAHCSKPFCQDHLPAKNHKCSEPQAKSALSSQKTVQCPHCLQNLKGNPYENENRILDLHLDFDCTKSEIFPRKQGHSIFIQVLEAKKLQDPVKKVEQVVEEKKERQAVVQVKSQPSEIKRPTLPFNILELLRAQHNGNEGRDIAELLARSGPNQVKVVQIDNPEDVFSRLRMSSDNEESNQEKKEKRVVCDQCSKSFENWEALLKHAEEAHYQQNQKKDNGDDMY